MSLDRIRLGVARCGGHVLTHAGRLRVGGTVGCTHSPRSGRAGRCASSPPRTSTAASSRPSEATASPSRRSSTAPTPTPTSTSPPPPTPPPSTRRSSSSSTAAATTTSPPSSSTPRAAKPTVLDVVDLSGLEARRAGDSGPARPAGTHPEFNEHVWYSLPTVEKLADRLATDLAATDPAGTTTYTANASRLQDPGRRPDRQAQPDQGHARRRQGRDHRTRAALPRAGRRPGQRHTRRVLRSSRGGQRPARSRAERDPGSVHQQDGQGAAAQRADRERVHQAGRAGRHHRRCPHRPGHRDTARQASTTTSPGRAGRSTSCPPHSAHRLPEPRGVHPARARGGNGATATPSAPVVSAQPATVRSNEQTPRSVLDLDITRGVGQFLAVLSP